MRLSIQAPSKRLHGAHIYLQVSNENMNGMLLHAPLWRRRPPGCVSGSTTAALSVRRSRFLALPVPLRFTWCDGIAAPRAAAACGGRGTICARTSSGRVNRRATWLLRTILALCDLSSALPPRNNNQHVHRPSARGLLNRGTRTPFCGAALFTGWHQGD